MAFERYEARRNGGGQNLRLYKKAASTVIERGDLMAVDASGFVTPAAVTTDPAGIIGVSARKVAATDSDYADNSEILIDEPISADDTFVVTGSGLDQADTGAKLKLGASAGVISAVAVGGGEFASVVVKKIISATKAVVTLRNASNNA